MLFDDKEEAESDDEASETPAQRKKKSDEALKKRKLKEDQKTKNKKAKKDTGKSPGVPFHRIISQYNKNLNFCANSARLLRKLDYVLL